LSSTSSGSSVSSSSDSSSSDSSSSSGGGGSYSPISSPASGHIASGFIQTANNALDGDPEYNLGGSSDQGQCIWDNNIAGGFDSTLTDFAFTVDLTGSAGITLGVDHSTATGDIAGSLGNSGHVSRIQVLAQAQSGGRFRFASLIVVFSRNGVPTQTINVSADSLPDADGSGGTESNQGLEFTPNASDYDGVGVQGVFQMTDPTPNTIPNLQCQILVFN
jgi:hypothetical protein